ncbi:lactase/phlorizin hydrolase-like [Ruditapes philippinarum]|uniref:lactase/phlorizin hydrolase-like n=1 Tax=Ruditapes philippinarum TaxID=129788 RepID=UPI00295AE460|nr:lactase/phlorizin hydrolase-like [Ruditapes philippinarum]
MMKNYQYLLVFFIVTIYGVDADDFYFGTFPSDFNWGLTTSVYNASTDGNYTAIQKLYDDIQGLKELGVKTLKFSLDWSSNLDPATEQFYSLMIKELQNNGIEPHITLFDDEIPQTIQATGGWLQDSSINAACDLAEKVFNLYDSKVKLWTTIADPVKLATDMYSSRRDNSVYKAVHNMLLAHSCIYHRYNDAKLTGQIGIGLRGVWFEPERVTEPFINDTLEKVFQFEIGWMLDPLINTGDYPKVMKDILTDKLPEFTDIQKRSINGSADFITVNYYETWLVTRDDFADNGAILKRNQMWKREDDPLTYMHPEGLRKLLKSLNERYTVDIYAELPDVNEIAAGVRDILRVESIREHTHEVLKGMLESYLDNKAALCYILQCKNLLFHD